MRLWRHSFPWRCEKKRIPSSQCLRLKNNKTPMSQAFAIQTIENFRKLKAIHVITEKFCNSQDCYAGKQWCVVGLTKFSCIRAPSIAIVLMTHLFLWLSIIQRTKSSQSCFRGRKFYFILSIESPLDPKFF